MLPATNMVKIAFYRYVSISYYFFFHFYQWLNPLVCIIHEIYEFRKASPQIRWQYAHNSQRRIKNANHQSPAVDGQKINNVASDQYGQNCIL